MRTFLPKRAKRLENPEMALSEDCSLDEAPFDEGHRA
jgi:hypothetical protein